MTPAPPATSIADKQDEPAPTSLTTAPVTPPSADAHRSLTSPDVEPDTIDEKKASLANDGQADDGVDRQRSLGEATVPDEEDDEEDNEEDDEEDDEDHGLAPTPSHAHDFWKFHMRPPDDDEPQDWWFASTAIPLLAATTGPLANVLSIAALVTSWRGTYSAENPGLDDDIISINDPRWCIALNVVSLVCGFAGNLFLLFNFTRFVRYIVALPATIILWFIASGILMSITVCMHVYAPPTWPEQTYSQGFWHAVIAAVLYFISALMLMVNMLGYFLGHYTQHFELTEEQRNLILQTMMFFFWLAGGAAVFARVCGWAYVDALYFCDVTVLTVGFGDFYANNDVGRGLVFPYSVGGIIMLGLMVSSINRFASELGQSKIVHGHSERRRVQTVDRSVASSFEAERRQALENALHDATKNGVRPEISAPFDPQQRTVAFEDDTLPRRLPEEVATKKRQRKRNLAKKPFKPLTRSITWASDKMSAPSTKGFRQVNTRKGRLLILREEKDRFMAMRAIQSSTRRFKSYFALSMSVIAFGVLWCVGAAVFWQCEQRIQGMTYFQGLYFCYVSLLTIGYGDLSPKSSAGKPFFIVWSLIAVPTMTILISDMSDTVVAAYKRGTFTLAAWTVLPNKGFFRETLDKHPWIMAAFKKLQVYANARERKKRIEHGFPVGPEEGVVAQVLAEEGETTGDGPTLEELAAEEPDEHDLARRLALAIRRTADHLKEGSNRRYTYEEWVEYTRLIRFSGFPPSSSSSSEAKSAELPNDLGIVDWDWIGPDSPMMSEQPESEWVLDRLCESLDRYMRQQLPEDVRARHQQEDADRRQQRQFSITSGGRSPRTSMDPGGVRVGSPPASPGGRLPRRWSVADPDPVLSLQVPARRRSWKTEGLDFDRQGDAASDGERSRSPRSRGGRRLQVTSGQGRGKSIEAAMRGERDEDSS